ncbi:MAG: hypothetical protein JWL76_1704 [Thermoleophilia bacterium]|nr:hypothetical protein [Thermoleophilia bacterium]
MKNSSFLIRRHVTYANVVSIIVIIAATATSAFAATMYTGRNIKDSSLTGVDFKDRSIDSKDIAATSRKSMTGFAGATGATGDKGGTGPQGDTGDAGDMGKQAHSLVRFASFHSPFLRTNLAALPNDPLAQPNPGTVDPWDGATYPTYDTGEPRSYPNVTENFPTNDFETTIDNSDQVLLQLTGQNETTTGTIRPTAGGLLNATATITVLHTNDGETNFAGGRALHNRLRCTLRFANNDNALGSGSPSMGAVEWISSRRQHKVYTITMTGSEKIPSDASANYNVGVSCADVDYTGSNHWKYIAGNITAHAIYVGP